MKDDYGCFAISSYNFSTPSSSLNLGTLKLPPGSTIMVSGTVTDCNNNPLANGRIFVYKQNNICTYNMNGSTYNFPVTNSCTSSIQIAVDVINTITNEESISSNYTIDHQNITLPNIVACGQTTTEYANFTINDESYMLGPYNNGTFTFGCGFSGDRTAFSPTLLKLKNGVYIMNDDHIQWAIYHGYNAPPSDTNYICYFNLYRGIDSGFTELALLTEGVTHNPFTWSTAPVTITEYGAPGGYVSGSYSGILYRQTSYATLDFAHPYYINLNFRSKRFQ